MKGSFEALDLETRWVNSYAVPICVSITNNERVLYKFSYDSPKEIVKFLISKCSYKKVYYVHNLTFEAFVLMPILSELGISYKVFSSDNIVYKMSIFVKKNNVVRELKLRCSYRLTLLPLKELAVLCNLQKWPFPYKLLFREYNKIVKVREGDFNSKGDFEKFIEKNNRIIRFDLVLERYCSNDAKISKVGVAKFLEAISTLFILPKKTPLTASSLSLAIFFLKKTTIKKNLKSSEDDLIRKAYFGGRCEVFGNLEPEEVALHFDFTGMYASCMEDPLPSGNLKIREVDRITSPGFYLIRFKQSMYMPVLPIKHEKSLLFANGVHEGWYWHEEIELFLEMGGDLLQVKASVTFTSTSEEVKDFVLANNQLRSLGGIYNLIGKNNNNTFYGRLGMNPASMVDELTNYKPDKYELLRVVNGVYSNSKRNSRTPSNVAISAAITSKARIKLYRGFLSVQKSGGRVLYSDTDSIVAAFPKNSYKKKLDRKIGEVYFDSTKKDTVIQSAVFALPKTYAIRLKDGTEIIKVKGFNNNSTSFNEFNYIFKNGGSYQASSQFLSKKNLQIKINMEIKQTNLSALSKRDWIFNKTRTLPKLIKGV